MITLVFVMNLIVLVLALFLAVTLFRRGDKLAGWLALALMSAQVQLVLR